MLFCLTLELLRVFINNPGLNGYVYYIDYNNVASHTSRGSRTGKVSIWET